MVRLNGHREDTWLYLQVWRMVGSDFNLVGSQLVQVNSSSQDSYEDVEFDATPDLSSRLRSVRSEYSSAFLQPLQMSLQ